VGQQQEESGRRRRAVAALPHPCSSPCAVLELEAL